MKQIIVIGAGAAGLVSAIWASRGGARVILLEHTDRVGKKILVTGNGHCNFTNQEMRADCFRGGSRRWVQNVLERFGQPETLEFFRSLGIVPTEKNGYFYPASGQATAILDALRCEIVHQNVNVYTNVEIKCIKKWKGQFVVEQSNGEKIAADALILACGSKAAKKTGSDGSGYEFAKKFGHSIEPVLPALTCLRTKGTFLKQWAGVRTQGEIRVMVDGKLWEKDRGELQLTDYGVSGIPTFQVSRYASLGLFQRKQVVVSLDFLPNYDEKETLSFLQERKKLLSHLSMEEGLEGMFHKKLVGIFLKEAGISPVKRWSAVRFEELKCLAGKIKNIELEVTGTGDFEQAQVCAGGVSVKEINPETMESKLVSGLYFAGEMIDIDGICGGYNLQFAWSSGSIAGKCAAR